MEMFNKNYKFHVDMSHSAADVSDSHSLSSIEKPKLVMFIIKYRKS